MDTKLTETPAVYQSWPSAGRGFIDFLRRRPAELIVALAVLVRVPLIVLPITYRQDIWRQADTASIARNFLTDPNILFPRINWGGAGPGIVEAEFQLYPWAVAVLYRLFGEQVWLGRALSLAISGLTLWLFWRLAARLLTPRAALIALSFFAVCPMFLRYSTAFMPEAAMMAGYVGALLLFDRWLESRRWSLAIACGGVTALAGLVKPTALNVGIAFAVALLLRREWRRLWSPQALVLAGVAVLPVAAWLWHGVRLHAEYGNTFGVISGGDRKFGDLSYWTSLEFYTGAARVDLLWIFVLGTAPLAAIGLWVAIARRGPALVIAGPIAIVFYYFAVARAAQGDLGIQYHAFTVVFAGLAVGLGTDWLLRRRATAHNPGRFTMTAALVAVAVVFTGAGGLAYGDQFRGAGTWALACGNAIRTVVPPGDLVVITSRDVAYDNGTPNNFQDPTLFFHGDRRGWSLAVDQDPALIETYRQQGARWLIVAGGARLGQRPALAAYVAARPDLGPGVEAGCGIFPLSS